MPSVSSILFAVSALVVAVASHPVANDREHVERSALPGKWYRDEDDQAHALFRRADAPATPLPAVGSPEWIAKYPAPGATPSIVEKDIPAAWVAAYKAAVSNGLIPAIPPSVIVQDSDYNQTPTYPPGFAAESALVCSTTVQCYNATDITKALDGMIGISFDDGPAEGSKVLYDFLSQNHQKSTHFLIGGNIVQQPDLFMQAFRMNGDLAIHTWSHPYMTAQSDYGVLAELGWTMQIIYDSTGGRIPRFWRPPYGDQDNRVRGIAEHVFGLTAVMWNKDTNDWAMPDGQTAAQIATDVETWLSGPKSPGLMILEHELTNDTSNVFINTTWPAIQKYQWRPFSIAQMYGDHGFNYANAKDNVGPVVPNPNLATSVTVTGHSPLPTWYSQTASTSFISASTTSTSTTSAPTSSASTPTPVPTNAPAPGAGGAQAGSGSQGSPASPNQPDNSQSQGSNTSDQQPTPGSSAGVTRPRLTFVAAVLALAVMA